MRRALPLLAFPALLSLALLAQQAKRDTAKKAPLMLEPPQPVLSWIYPAGGQRGATVLVTATGAGGAADSVLVTGDGVTAVPRDGKLAVTIAPGAEPGERELRIVNAGGISNRARFVVGDLPEIEEREPNNEFDQAQRIGPVPVVINGQITEADRDYFRFHARAGEALLLEVRARAQLPYIADAVPGWFDPQLTVFDANGKQVAFADDNRFDPDPVLRFEPPADGDYTVELRDVIYRGRGDFVYRLTLRTAPPEQDASPTEPAPNDTLEHALRIVTPAAVEGCIDRAGTSRWFVGTAARGERLVMEVRARRAGSPLDSILTLYDAKRNQLAENDDWTDPLAAHLPHNADSRIAYTFAAAGDFYLRVRDVQGKSGAAYTFRLSVAPPHPDFTLRIAPDNPRLGRGDTAAITVAALRHDDFAGEIQLTVQGLPPGYIASDAWIAAGQNEGRLTISAPATASPGILNPVVTGAATIGTATVTHRAESAEAVMQAFASTHILPTSRLFLAVIPASAYTLTSDIPEGKVMDLHPGSETPIAIKVLRKEGVAAGVTITAVRLANNTITTKGVFVAPDKDTAEITLTVARDAKVGLRQNVIVSGLMRTTNQAIVRYTRAIPIRIVAP